jgi:hypothetical protein
MSVSSQYNCHYAGSYVAILLVMYGGPYRRPAFENLCTTRNICSPEFVATYVPICSPTLLASIFACFTIH